MQRFHHLKRANSFTFWFWCVSLISPVTYNETIRRFSLISPSGRPLALYPVFEATRLRAFVPCLRGFHCLLTARAESGTHLREDKEWSIPGKIVSSIHTTPFTSHMMFMF
jgi:hypothetical protein